MKKPTTSRRSSLLAILFIFSYLSTTAQTIFFEDFQNGMPGNFTLYDQDSLTPDAGVSFVNKAWVIKNESTDSVVVSTSWYNPIGTADDWLVTPAIVLTSDNILSWEARAENAAWPDGYEVRISTLSNSIADFLSNPPLFSIAGENVTWTERFINLGDSGYANQTVYIAFRNNSTDKYLLYIDDIRIGLPVKKDLAVVDLILPTNSCDLSSTEEITAMITNYGIDTINNFNISYEIDSKTPITENVSQTIFPGDTLTYTFTTKADLSTTDSTYTFKAFTSLSGDEDLFNDTLDNYLITHISPQNITTDPLVIGFESTDDLTGWSTIDNNSDGYTWSQTSSAYNGSLSLAYIADVNKSTGADDWYFTKCLNLDSGKNYLLSFYHNSFSSEYFKVMLGTDQSVAGMTDTIHDFGKLTASNNTTAAGYTQHNSSLSISTAGTYYIGFHIYTPDSSYAFLLDDLELRELPDNDISIIDIESPLSGCNHTNSESLVIKMQNNGINSVSNFDVTYVLNNSLIITETVTDTLKSLETLTYNFTSTLDLSIVQDYDLEIYISLNLDEDKTNDTISSNISNVTHNFQNGALEMGFESNEDFSGWDVLDNNSDGTSWNSGQYPNNGSMCEIYLGDQVSGADDWLFTKCMNLDTGKLYQLSFYYVPYSNEYLKVMLGTDQTVAGMTDTIHDFDSLAATNALTYSYYSTTIQVDTSGVYYIGFHIYTPSNSYALLLDDIKIKELIPYDLAINAMSEPISSCLPGNNESVTIDIINEGTTTINNFQVGFILDGNAPVIEVIPDTLNNLDVISYTFTQTVDLSDLLDHSLTVFGILGKDQNPNNDSLFSTIQYSSHDFSNGPFTMSFEDNEDLSGWLISDINNDNYTWKVASSPYANSGDQYMGYSYNAADLSIGANDWLYTTCLDMDTAITYQLSFYYKVASPDFPEKLRVLLMTEQDTISITDTIIDLGEISSTAIQLSSERFTVPDQDQYYIAFQVYSGPDKWILAIDDIEVTIIPDGPACSGADTLTATSGTFEDGSGLFDYGNNSDCSWLIAPPGATSINLTFDFFNIEYGFDTLFVHDGASTSAPLLAAYTDAGLPNDISSSGGEMLVRFVTNDQNTSDGWEISYTSNLTIFCSGTDTFTTSTGIVSDGSGAYDYNNNADCKWLIQPAGAASIDLSFKTFDTEADADSVFVYDGGTTSDSLLGVFSGTNLPGNLSSSAGTMLIHFKTDNDSTQAGWKAKYTSKYEGNCEGFYYFTASYDTIGDGSDSSNYANNSNCEWLIQPSGASSITLTFLSFETQTLNDKVIVYDGEDETGTILGTFSGDSLPSELKSTAGQMFVQFISDDTITAKGWQAVYDAEFLGFCSGLVTLTKPSGTFGDGSGSGKYANNSNCKWLLQPGGATSITLNFNYFKTEDKLDRVIVYDGTSDNDPLLGSYSGSDLPPSLTSSGGAMYLQFFSDEMVNTSGWEASYCTPTSLPLAVASIDQIICRGDSAQLSASGGESYSWSPTMGLDNHAISNPIAKPDSNIVYVVTVKNEDGCSNTDSLMITVTPIQENICFVTIDSSSADNLIVWEKINMDKVESYNIYKEGSQSNVYDLIGNVSHSDLSIFLDTTSNPKQRSYRYTLSVLDSCGNESGLSSFHKTMHLTVNLGVNDVINLIWENYEGFTFSTYRIWRGTSDSNFVILDSIPGNITTFTDDQPPVSDSLYYQLEILHPVGCEATAKRARGYGSARSNTANMANPRADTTSDTTVVISHYYNENNFKIYPNPYKDHTNISYTLTSKQDVQIEIYNLLSKKIYTVVSQKQNKGYYNYEFSAGKLEYPSGIYILKAEFGNTGRFSKQLIELK